MDTRDIQISKAPQWWQALASTTAESPDECERLLEHLRASLRAGAVPPPTATWRGIGLLSALFFTHQPAPDEPIIEWHADPANAAARTAMAAVLMAAGHDPAAALAAVPACVDPGVCAWNAAGTDMNPALASPIACAVASNSPALLRLLVETARRQGAVVPTDIGFGYAGGDTWLHAAMRHRRLGLVETLLDLGWDPAARNALGETAFHLAWDADILRTLCRKAPLPARLAPSLLGYWIDLPEASGLMEAVAHRRAFRQGAVLRDAWRAEGSGSVQAEATVRLPGSKARFSARALALLEIILDIRGTRHAPLSPSASQARQELANRLCQAPPPWSLLERSLALRAARCCAHHGVVLAIPSSSACLPDPPALPAPELAVVLFHAITRRAVYPPVAPGAALTLWPAELADIFAPDEVWPVTRALAPWLAPSMPPHRNTSVSTSNLAGSLCAAALPHALPQAATTRDVDLALRLMASSRDQPVTPAIAARVVSAAANWTPADWKQARDMAWDVQDVAMLAPPAYRHDVRTAPARWPSLRPLHDLCARLRAVREQCRAAECLAAPTRHASTRLRA